MTDLTPDEARAILYDDVRHAMESVLPPPVLSAEVDALLASLAARGRTVS